MKRRNRGIATDWRRLRPRVTDRLLRSITERIVKDFDPRKVVLFGSYDYGRPNLESDVDLLVIMETKERPARRASQILAACRPKHLDMDVVVLTPGEVRRRRAGFDPFLEEILAKGRVLYESTR